MNLHFDIQDMDDVTNRFNIIRTVKRDSTDEELREEVIPYHLKMINVMLDSILFALHTEYQNICVIKEFKSIDADLLETGMQGVILSVSDIDDSIVVCFVEDMTCRKITGRNYKNIKPVPSIKVCITEDFTSTATHLYPSIPSLNEVM